MAIAAGTRLGQYEVGEQLGVGGMGEVYRATDTKLRREVAIKVLPDAFSQDPKRLTRFQREAHLLASLNHPNIAAIYGLEESGNTQFLVLELVEGETLADRLTKGAISFEESFAFAKQVAEALEAAHEKGVIHRDLKPANIKVTPDGTVKVLDFGLAKAFESDGRSVDLSQMQTATVPEPTLDGTILGTPAYMSPEQARGREVDKRTDIWSFGCVLYEMLSGKRGFESSSLTEIIAQILRDDPDWEALPTLPPSIRKLLVRCLIKDPNRRLRDIGEARIEIEGAASGERVTSPEVSGGTARSRLAWVASLVLAVGVGGFAAWNLKPPPSQAPLRFKMDLGERLAEPGFGGGVLALSTDGSRLAFVADGQLHLRPLYGFQSQPIPGTEGASDPFFSADGRSVGFWVGRDLKSASIDGPNVRTICRCAPPIRAGTTWGDDDTIVFSGGNTPLLKVSASGGVPEPLTIMEAGEAAHRSPHFLPGGKAVLFAVSHNVFENQEIAVLSLETGKRSVLVEGGRHPSYVNTGHMIYSRMGTLMAVPFDADRLEVSGSALAVIDDAVDSRLGFNPSYALSATGTIVYIPRTSELNEYSLVWRDRDRNREPLDAFPPDSYGPPSLSPNGEKVALGVGLRGAQSIWMSDISDGSRTRLTYPASDAAGMPLWSPDGESVTYNSRRRAGAMMDILRVRADGSGQEEQLTTTLPDVIYSAPESYSPDGVLAFHQGVGRRDIYTLRPGEEPEPLVATPARETAAMFSPDGNWVAFVSDESGRAEIWVTPYPPERGRPRQITTEGGYAPVWSPKGDELFYRNADKLMVLEVTTEPNFQAVNSKELFRMPMTRHADGISRADYDIHPDGQRFLMLESAAELTSLNVIVNWSEELKERVPVP